MSVEQPPPSERSTHCQRVAYLCGRVGKILSLEGSADIGLIIAANLHHAYPSSEPRPSTEESGFEGMVIRNAQEILRNREGSSGLAAGILGACNEFDEAIEFAAYEGCSVTAAIAEFFSDAAPRIEPRILGALRRIASARTNAQADPDLPVLPSAVSKLVRSSPDAVSAGQLESIAGSDPVLAGRLLGTANSALLGSRWEIKELRAAILRLGIPLAHKVLLGACLRRIFASRDLADLWKHSSYVAAAAYELAGACNYDRDTAYVAGLLHDVGRILLQRSPAESRAEEQDLLAAGFPRVYAESLIYGADHAAMGARLLKEWGLPSDIVKAVEFHDRPESTNSVLAGILYAAEDSENNEPHVRENLATGMRSAAAVRNAGLDRDYRKLIDRESPVFALAG